MLLFIELFGCVGLCCVYKCLNSKISPYFDFTSIFPLESFDFISIRLFAYFCLTFIVNISDIKLSDINTKLCYYWYKNKKRKHFFISTIYYTNGISLAMCFFSQLRFDELIRYLQQCVNKCFSLDE